MLVFGEGLGDSPVEDSDDDLIPGSLCNVIPGMVNIDTAGKLIGNRLGGGGGVTC